MTIPQPLQEALNREPNVVLLVDRNGMISFLNREWTRAAERDGAPPGCGRGAVLHRPYLDFVAGALRPYVASAFARAASLGPGFESVWLHGECNTDTLCRRLTTRISPLATGFLVHHELRVVGPLSERYSLVEFTNARWRGADKLIVQCGCCRRVREPRTGHWEMCVALLSGSDVGTTHGLCELCGETYYPDYSDATASGAIGLTG